MSKSALGLSLPALLLLAGRLSAGPVAFQDVHDPADFLMGTSVKEYSFTHDINDEGFNPLTDSLISATITIDLRDDTTTGPDGTDNAAGNTEQVTITLDGNGEGTREVNFADFSIIVSVAFLQTDGLLAVKLEQSHGDFLFRKSTLDVTGDRDETTPPGPGGGGNTVPEPSVLLLCGMGAVASYLSRRKKAH